MYVKGSAAPGCHARAANAATIPSPSARPNLRNRSSYHSRLRRMLLVRMLRSRTAARIHSAPTPILQTCGAQSRCSSLVVWEINSSPTMREPPWRPSDAFPSKLTHPGPPTGLPRSASICPVIGFRTSRRYWQANSGESHYGPGSFDGRQVESLHSAEHWGTTNPRDQDSTRDSSRNPRA